MPFIARCHAMQANAMPSQAAQCNGSVPAAYTTTMPPCSNPSLPSAPPQSCALLGIFSYFVDGMSGGEAQAAGLRSTPAAAAGTAAAAPAGEGATPASGGGTQKQQHEEQVRQWQQQRKAVEQFLTPDMPLLSAAAPCVFA